MRRTVLGSLICVLATAACAGPSRIAPARIPARGERLEVVPVGSPPQQPRLLQPFPDMNGQAGAAWIPWAVLDLHERRKTPGAPPADVDEGRGFALRGGRYDDALGMEFVFATTEHDERRTGAELRTYAAYVDLTDRWELWRGPVFAWAGIGVGFGLIQFDWDSTYKSELTGLWQGEGILALQVGRNVSLEARATGFLAAHPTRTAGLGSMVMLGGTIAF